MSVSFSSEAQAASVGGGTTERYGDQRQAALVFPIAHGYSDGFAGVGLCTVRPFRHPQPTLSRP